MEPAPPEVDAADLAPQRDARDGEATLRRYGEQVDVVGLAAQYEAGEHRPNRCGPLADLVEWAAGTQSQWPPGQPTRPRLVCVGEVGAAAASLASTLEVGTRSLAPGPDPQRALAAGIAAANDEVDRGADLVVLADPGDGVAAAVVVSLLTGIEPVALLPRGADAVDSAQWVDRARRLRDLRRTASGQREEPDELLAAVADPSLSACAGFLMQAVARRTAVLLDGVNAVTAALLCLEVAPLAGGWWRIADSGPDPVHQRAAEYLDQRPVLGMGTSSWDGMAGLIALTSVRAAMLLARDLSNAEAVGVRTTEDA